MCYTEAPLAAIYFWETLSSHSSASSFALVSLAFCFYLEYIQQGNSRLFLVLSLPDGPFSTFVSPHFIEPLLKVTFSQRPSLTILLGTPPPHHSIPLCCFGLNVLFTTWKYFISLIVDLLFHTIWRMCTC